MLSARRGASSRIWFASEHLASARGTSRITSVKDVECTHSVTQSLSGIVHISTYVKCSAQSIRKAQRSLRLIYSGLGPFYENHVRNPIDGTFSIRS